MNYNFRQSGHLGLLVYYDKMTADMKDEFQKALMSSLGNVGHLFLYIEKMADISDPFINTLCSASKYCNNANKRLTLIGNKTSSLKQTIKDSGRINISTCVNDCYNQCLWT